MTKRLIREVIEYFEGENGPLRQMFEDADIGDFDDIQWTWEDTLAGLRNPTIPADELGKAIDESVIALYRKLLAH